MIVFSYRMWLNWHRWSLMNPNIVRHNLHYLDISCIATWRKWMHLLHCDRMKGTPGGGIKLIPTNKKMQWSQAWKSNIQQKSPFLSNAHCTLSHTFMHTTKLLACWWQRLWTKMQVKLDLLNCKRNGALSKETILLLHFQLILSQTR